MNKDNWTILLQKDMIIMNLLLLGDFIKIFSYILFFLNIS